MRPRVLARGGTTALACILCLGLSLLQPNPAQAQTPGGYWLLGTDGGVFSFGDARFHGSVPQVAPASTTRKVGMASTPGGRGYWIAAEDGGVFSFGDARFHGSMGGRPLAAAVTGIASTPTGRGYWLSAADGGVFAFGDAGFHGSLGGRPLAGPVVGVASSPSGRGYWLLGLDGGVFGFGDARFHGSVPQVAPSSADRKVALVPTTGGRGYWIAAEDGGVFSFGDARFQGSMGGRHLHRPVSGMSAAGGGGYWLSALDGGVFGFGATRFHGSMGGRPLHRPVIAMLAPGARSSGGGALALGLAGPRSVMLTFDDGPDPANTLRILEILNRYAVPATFFVLGGNASRRPGMVREAAGAHSIQNHTWTHTYLRGLSEQRFSDEVDRTTALIHELAGRAPRCLRPPGGSWDATVARRLQQRGLGLVLWDVDTNDWRKPGVARIVDTVIRDTRPGSVILMHDATGNREQTIAALPRVIEELTRRGYSFATVC